MRRLASWALLVLLTGCAAAPLATVSWSDATPRSGRVVGDAVRIESSTDGGTYPVISFTTQIPPGVSYAIEGEVRYQDVTGEAYLEMWSDFPGEGRYFSRTLAPSGLQGIIEGDSDWRGFQISFVSNGGPPPARLDVNLVLPGTGTVEIGPLRVVTLDGGSGWWTDRAAGAIGAAAGGLIGILGAGLGILASRRKARGPVLATMIALSVLGVLSLVAGAVAFVARQPYAVVFPLLLLGTILLAVFGGGYRAVRRGYEEAELRKMHALDAAGV